MLFYMSIEYYVSSHLWKMVINFQNATGSEYVADTSTSSSQM